MEVSRTGDVRLYMHSENPDGTRVNTINLSGKIREGLFKCSGKFLNGRSATPELAPGPGRRSLVRQTCYTPQWHNHSWLGSWVILSETENYCRLQTVAHLLRQDPHQIRNAQ
jgi:hypothetical protein